MWGHVAHAGRPLGPSLRPPCRGRFPCKGNGGHWDKKMSDAQHRINLKGLEVAISLNDIYDFREVKRLNA